MKTQQHNPDYKLISKTVQLNKATKVELVYGETNDGKNKGLEAYYFKNGLNHIHKSNRWQEGLIPNRWLSEYNQLASLLNKCPNGHKLTL